MTKFDWTRRGLPLLVVAGVLAFFECTRGNGEAAPAAFAAPAAPGAPAAPDPIDATIAAAAQRCADEPLPKTGAVHYVCDCAPGAAKGCVPGDDTSQGRSPAHPWRSFVQASTSFEAMAAGDTLAFCRGGAFQAGPDQWVNRSCRAGRPCTVRDYTPPWAKAGKPPAPKLIGAKISFANSGNAEHEEGYRFFNLELDGAGDGEAFLVFNDVSDVQLCNLTIDRYALAINVEGANEPAPGSSGRNARVSLRGSRVTNNAGGGWLGACNECVVADNLFDHNGGANMFDHNVYVSGPRDFNRQLYPIVGMKVTGNKLRRSARGAGGTCQGNSLVVHGDEQDLLIEGNDILEEPGAAGNGCWGIAVDAAYPEAEAFRNVVIRRNRVVDVGNTAIEVTSCAHCTIEDNLIIQTQTAFGATGIAAGDRGRSRQPSDLPMDAVTIRNNTVVVAGDAPGESAGIVVADEGSGHVIVGNAIVGGGKNWSCFVGGLKPPALRADYNLCWNRRAPEAWRRDVGSLEAAKAAGLDLHSLARDPNLPAAGASTHALPPGAGSPLIGAGDPSNSPTTDFEGNPRGKPPDIGAFQHRSK